MIDRDEIVNKARELGVHHSNVQRDYVFGWVLAGIYSVSDLGNHLILKGGNCFRKVYFAKARYSPDLDFASTAALSEEYIASELIRVCGFVELHAGVRFNLDRTRVEPKHNISQSKDVSVHEAKLYFRDFFGRPGEMVISIRLDITEFDKVFLPVQTRNLIHAYSDQSLCTAEVKCLKLEEMLAGKLKCLIQRRHSADLYDFANAVFVSPSIEINRSEVVSTFFKMTIFAAGPRFVSDLLSNLPFSAIRSLWQKHLIIPRDAVFEFDRAVEGFLAVVKELFSSLPVGRSDIAFFPLHLRNVILEAGNQLTLLRIVYDGVEREVEPYSLKYKTRRDGFAREYFYVYDRSGGRGSNPGIKSLLHEKIQVLENTGIHFEPRYEVELSKAGQYFRERYFHRTARSVSTLRRTRTTRRKSTRYTFECIVCGKKFYRDKYNSTLKAHKDRYGNRCIGRRGFLA